MKRRIFSILTALALCLGLLPLRAFAADAPVNNPVLDISEGSISISEDTKGSGLCAYRQIKSEADDGLLKPYTGEITIGAGVEMGGDQYLVIIAPHPLCQFHAESVAQLRGDLAGLEALISMVGHIAARLAKPLLDRLHFLKSGVPVAVHAGDKHGPFLALNGLFLVGSVVENLL